MVRGNWQKRVETADARRKEAKQRKQRTDDRRQHKAWVGDCLAMLDRHGRRPLRVHLWTDAMASDGPPLLDIVDFIDDGSGGGGGGSGAGGVLNSKAAKRRARSGSLSESHPDAGASSVASSKKKVHPRSSAAAAAAAAGDPGDEAGRDVAAPLLCKAHFFFGKCSECVPSSRRKSSGCRYVHYSSQYRSVASVLNEKRATPVAGEDNSDARQKSVELSENAAGVLVEGDGAMHKEAMEMVYYSCVELKHPDEPESENEVAPLSLSEEILDALAGMNISSSSVVYVVINNSLIFDRCRQGVLVNDREFLFILKGQPCELGGGRRSSVESVDDEIESLETTLPGFILEHILTFLPDTSVAAATRVCKAWHHEIGQNSPELWKHLLQRRGWPIPDSLSSPEEDREASRAAFLQHYTAVRDLRAIKQGAAAILVKSNVAEVEMSYQDFAARKHAPSHVSSFECVSVQVWSPSHILTAYARDCSLRLFETVPRGGGGGGCGGVSVGADGLLCREIVCRRVDPYRNTKRRHCSILSVGLDDETIGCLCRVMADSVDVEAHVLVVLSREDFLVGDGDYSKSGQDESLRVIDIGEAVLNFLLSSDVADHQLLQVMDFLSSNEGEVGDVEILASRSVAACGHGRFMIEVSIAIPDMDDVDGEGNWQMRLIYRQLVLFSATAGAIVWMGDSNGLLPRHLDMTLTSHMSLPFPGASRMNCSVLVASPVRSVLLVASIGPTGVVECSRYATSDENSVADGWDDAPQTSPAAILVSTDAITVQVLHKRESRHVVDRKSNVRFYRRFPTATEPAFDCLTISGTVEVERIARLGDGYVILLGRDHAFTLGRAYSDPANEDPSEKYRMAAVAILVHVESRREVHRLNLFDSVADVGSMPELSSSASGGTIGIALSCKGVIMTGSCVRSIAEPRVIQLNDAAPSLTRSAKKKKKKVVPKSNKKDGFARGMSLRG
jgi:F-box-like